MTIDPFAPRLSSMRHAGRSSSAGGPARRPHSAHSTAQLTVRYSPSELRRCFRAVQSPLSATVAALGFAAGVVMVIMGLLTLSPGTAFLVIVGLKFTFFGGLVMSVPTMQARRVGREHGVDGVVTLRLLLSQHGLMVEDHRSTTMTPWVTIERVQTNDRHVGLVSGGNFVVPPLRLDDEQGPFVARMLAHVHGAGVTLPPTTGVLRRSPASAGRQSWTGVLAGALAIAVITLAAIRVFSGSDSLSSCPDGQLAIVTQPAGPNTPLVVDCVSS